MVLWQNVNVILKWWWLILASVILSVTSSYLATWTMPRTYQTRTTIMVGQALSGPDRDDSGFHTGEALAQSYADLARREPVLQATLDALDLPGDWRDLQSRVTTRLVPGTQLLEIAVLDTDPQRAQVLADQVAQQLILQSQTAADLQQEAERQSIAGEIEVLTANIKQGLDEIRQLDEVIAQAGDARQIQDARDRRAALQSQVTTWQATHAELQTKLQASIPDLIRVVEPAPLPLWPVAPRVAYNLMLAAAIGLALSCVAVFLYEYMAGTLQTPDDVERELKLTTLGAITHIRGESNPLKGRTRDGYASKLITVKQPRSPISAAYRVLCANLQSSTQDRPIRALMVTSANPVEGKSITAANLAVVMAQSGTRVILVDADLWRPVQHRIFGLPNHVGLTTALLDTEPDPAAVLRETSTRNLRVLPSGPPLPYPAGILGARRMGELIQALERLTDVVIVDSPAVMAVADASALAARADGTLLVVDPARTRRASARRSLAALQAVNASVLGVALNRLSERSNVYHAYYHSPESKQNGHSPDLAAQPVEPPARQERAEAISPALYSAPGAEAVAPTDDVPPARPAGGNGNLQEAVQSGPVPGDSSPFARRRLWRLKPVPTEAGAAQPVEISGLPVDAPAQADRSMPVEPGPAGPEPAAAPTRDEPAPPAPRAAKPRPAGKKRAPNLQDAIRDSLQDIGSQLPPP